METDLGSLFIFDYDDIRNKLLECYDIVSGQKKADFVGFTEGCKPYKDLYDKGEDIRKIIKHLGIKGKAIISNYKGKDYIILKGLSGTRPMLNAPRYLLDNPKIMKVGIGYISQTKKVLKGFILDVVLGVGTEVYEYFSKKDDVLNLIVGVSFEITKAIVSAILYSVVAFLVGTVTTITWIPILVGAVAVFVFDISLLDGKSDEMKDTIVKRIKNFSAQFQYEFYVWFNQFTGRPYFR